MVKQIETERVYLKSIDGDIRRYQDEFGTFWYVYKEICSALLIPERSMKDIFNNWLDDCDKNEFNDTKHQRTDLYVTTYALSKMLSRQHAKANGVLKEIINNENRENVFELTELDKKIKRINDINNQPGVTNYVDICLEIRDIVNMDDYRQTMDKYCKDYNIEIEEAVDRIREYMYEGEIDYIIGESKEGDKIIELYKENDVWNTWIQEK